MTVKVIYITLIESSLSDWRWPHVEPMSEQEAQLLLGWPTVLPQSQKLTLNLTLKGHIVWQKLALPL